MKHKRHTRLYLPLLAASLGLPLIVGVIGSLFTTPEIPTWYAYLDKPPFNPPSWVFGPVWTLLYIFQGVAFYLVVTAKSKYPKQRAIALYMIQLLLNLAWSIIFFGMHNIGLALVEMILFWVILMATTHEFFRHSRRAGQLLLPVVAWVSFAFLINVGVVYLN